VPTSFTGIPDVPQEGLDEWQFRILSTIKENVELLTGSRGASNADSKALTSSSFSVQPPVPQKMVKITATGAGASLLNGFVLTPDGSGGFTVDVTGRSDVPLLSDYNNLARNVQELANDVARLRNTVEILITQIRG